MGTHILTSMFQNEVNDKITELFNRKYEDLHKISKGKI